MMDNYDEIIFSDTGGEFPETYEYLQSQILPYVREHRIRFTVVKNQNWSGLEDYCLKTRHFPSWSYRWCTRDFKVRPIRYYLKKNCSVLPAISVMGISCDEVGRMRTDHPPEFTYEYPLVEKGMSRPDCENFIRSNGLPVPPKSGCHFCPYLNKKQLRLIHDKHPDLWERRRQLEHNSKAFPKAQISAYGNTEKLEQIFGVGNEKLDQFIEEDPCDTGYCMV